MVVTADDAAFDVRVREAIARAIKRRGLIPAIADVARDLATDEAIVTSSFDRMIAGHVFVAKRGSSEVHAYNPFCAVRTDFRVRADGREWWAMCGWDALGIPAALGTAGTVETSCADCGAKIIVDVDRDGTPSAAAGAVLHVGVRAIDFWKDIYHT